MDTANNCEAFMSRLLRKAPERSSFPTTGLKGNGTNIKPKSSVNKNKPKPPTKFQNSLHNPVKGANYNFDGNGNNIHRDLGNPIVEVNNQSSKPKSRTNAGGDREPWGKLLQNRNNDNASKFSTFDPLRTLHFLAKELQYKLQNDLPDDNNLQQIVLDMQHALVRIPPEIASAIQLQNFNEQTPLKRSSSSHSILNIKKYEDAQIPKKNRSCQTVHKHEDIEMIKKIMEGSTLKLEASCRQMEMLCGRLKSEKDDLEDQLKTEKENVKFLKKRVGDLEVQCDQLVSVTIKRLEEEKNELQLQVNKLTDVVDSQSVHTSYELKTVTQELKQVQMKAEQECAKLKHQLTLANMEKEKYIAILTVRDRQISEIRTEMSQLQDVVNEQLMDIHNNALSDLPSSNSFETDNVWEPKVNANDESDNNSNLSFLDSQNPFSDNFSKGEPNACQDFQAKQSHTNSELPQFDKNSKENLKKAIGNKNSIRNMFAELKKQAFAVTSMTVVKP